MANSRSPTFLLARSSSPLLRSLHHAEVSAILHPGEILALPQITFALATEVSQVQVVSRVSKSLKRNSKSRKSSASSASFPISMSATFPMPLLSPRNKNSSSLGAAPLIQSTLQSSEPSQGFSRRTTLSAVTAKARKVTPNATAPLTPTRHRHLHRRCHFAFASETGSALFLQRHRHRALARSLRHRQFRHLQRRQWPLAGQLFQYPWQPRRWRHLQPLLSGGEPQWRGVNFENTLIGIGETAATNLFQEFVIRKLTPNLPHQQSPRHNATP